MSLTETVLLVVVSVCATVAAVLGVLSGETLAAVFGGIVGYGGKGIAVARSEGALP